MTGNPGLPPHYRLIALEKVDSTNAEAKRRAATGAFEENAVWAITAETQTKGKGRRGRVWDSPKGNLYCSLLFKPQVPVARAAQLGFVTSLALFDTLAAYTGPGDRIQCKWPNDILLNGRKVSGVLLESETFASGGLSWVVVGIGVNIARHPGETEFPATSLKAEGCSTPPPGDLLRRFIPYFEDRRGSWLEEGFAPIRAAWQARAIGRGDKITVRLDKETLTGIFAGLDEDGALIFRQNGNERRIAAGDVFIPTANGA